MNPTFEVPIPEDGGNEQVFAFDSFCNGIGQGPEYRDTVVQP